MLAIPGTAPLGKSLIAFIGAFVVVAGLGIALVEVYHRSGTTPTAPSATESSTHTVDTIPPPPASSTAPVPTATETAAAADAAVIEIPEPTATATATTTAPTATATATEAPTATVTATATATVVAPPTGGGGSLTSQASRALDRGQIQTAISLASQATAANPADAEAWLILGGAYEMVGNKAAARNAYKSCAASGSGSRVSECKALLGQ
jgi:Flp pilus assembly protein TadD